MKSIDKHMNDIYNVIKQLFGKDVCICIGRGGTTMNNAISTISYDDTYYIHSLKKRIARQRQVNRIRNMLVIIFSVIIILTISFLIVSFSAQASDLEHTASYKYYKSIQVENGDTLWSIAQNNMDEHYSNTSEYVAEVKQMNSLRSDQIFAGNYLIIPYYSAEFK